MVKIFLWLCVWVGWGRLLESEVVHWCSGKSRVARDSHYGQVWVDFLGVAGVFTP